MNDQQLREYRGIVGVQLRFDERGVVFVVTRAGYEEKS
jgi:hypothetical protein